MSQIVDRIRQDAADRLKSLVPLSMRRTLVRLRLRSREITGDFRTTPDFLIIGAQRSGTSSLYKWIGRHPNVAPSLRKEIEYFSVDYDKGERWYRAHFPLRVRRMFASLGGRRPWATFEATPDYLFDPRAPQRAFDLVPDAKLIVMLRKPEERAVSHYHHSVRYSIDDLSLEDALRQEADRLKPEWDMISRDPFYKAKPFRRFSYVARSRYAEQLERWFAVFPRDQILVLRSEDLFTAPESTFASILDFLGLPPWEPPEFRNYSYTGSMDSGYPEPGAWVESFLAERLAVPNTRLTELLGDGFTWDQSNTP